MNYTGIKGEYQMDILISIFKLLGGLALLIYGMKTLSTQLKKLSGSKLEQ